MPINNQNSRSNKNSVKIQLNCDMGESFGRWKKGQDAEIMPWVDLANIACGFHASDPQTMSQTVEMAKANQVGIGAHPGYPDLLGFGRKPMRFNFDEIKCMVLYQLGALSGICKAHRTHLTHIKPHGALYNMMMVDITVFEAVVQAVADFDDTLPLVAMAVPDSDVFNKIAQQYGLRLWFESFCDRAYADDGRLQSRQIAGSVYGDLSQIIEQARLLIDEKCVITYTGKRLLVHSDTICIHGDGPLALDAAKIIHTGLLV